jgi:hypothetical protein
LIPGIALPEFLPLALPLNSAEQRSRKRVRLENVVVAFAGSMSCFVQRTLQRPVNKLCLALSDDIGGTVENETLERTAQ